MNKLFLLIFIIGVIFPARICADTIHFKSGKRLDVPRAWEADGMVKCELYGSVVEYPKETVLKIERTQAKKSVGKDAFLGEWRDYMGDFWDCRIKIVRKNNEYYVVNSFSDGSGGNTLLVEIPVFKGYKQCFQNERGETYAIDRNGDLGLFDDQGFIRKASKIK